VQERAEQLATLESYASADHLVIEATHRGQLDSLTSFFISDIQTHLDTAVRSGALRRLTILVDTFERALREGVDFAGDALNMLWKFASAASGAMIIAGRGINHVPDHVWPVPPVHVGLMQLDEASAITLLHSQLPPNTAPSIALQLAADLPRRPLTLRLAARAVGAHASGVAPDDLALRQAIDRALVDGYLHLRILRHLNQPRLEALVHPGFALRRLSPELILELLSDRPTPPISGIDDARDLFAQLRKVSDLVGDTPDSPDADETLTLRTEVRRELLELMELDQPRAMREMHEKAAAWFAARSEPSARPEALYHLLAQGNLVEAERLWTPDLGPSLLDAMEELPDSARSWLGGKLRAAMPLQAFEGGKPAGVEEQATGRRLEVLIAERRLDAAAKLLQERNTSQPSDLDVLAVRVWRLRGQAVDTERAAWSALATPRSAAQDDELRRALVWAAARRRDVDAVLRRLDLAREPAITVGFSERQRLASIVDLADILGPLRASAARRALWALEDEIARSFGTVADGDLRSDQALLVRAGAHLHDAMALHRVVMLGAVDRIRDPYVDGLAMALSAGGEELAKDFAWTGTYLTVPWNGETPFPWRQALLGASRAPGHFAKLLLTLLERYPDRTALVETTRSLIAREAGVDADTGAVEARVAALQDAMRFVAEHVSPAEFFTVVEALGGPSVLGGKLEGDPGALVTAADAAGVFGALFTHLMAKFPGALRRLASLRDRIVRRAPFQHFPLDSVLDLHDALLVSQEVAAHGVEFLFQGIAPELLGAPDSSNASVRLLDGLLRLNETERLDGFVPLERLLQKVLRWSKGERAAALAQDLLNELWRRDGGNEHRVASVADAEPGVVAIVPRIEDMQLKPSLFRGVGSVLRAVARVQVPHIEGGRVVASADGRPGMTFATGWLVGPDLLMTADYVSEFGNMVDAEDRRLRALGTVAEFDLDDDTGTSPVRCAVRTLIRWSPAAGYLLLELEPRDRQPLSLAPEPFADGPIVIPEHPYGAPKRLVFGLGQRLDEDTLRYKADTASGSGGAPICDSELRVIGMHRTTLVGGGADRYCEGVTVQRILADLAVHSPETLSRIMKGA
jgi:hypothetical protein